MGWHCRESSSDDQSGWAHDIHEAGAAMKLAQQSNRLFLHSITGQRRARSKNASVFTGLSPNMKIALLAVIRRRVTQSTLP